MSQLFQVKSVDRMFGEAEHGKGQLRRVLGPFQLTVLGIGAVIGAGIFSTVGSAAAGGGGHVGAGPAIILSFALTAIACGFAACAADR